MGFARKAANRVVFMDDGQIVEEAEPEAFFTNAQSARAKDFLEQDLDPLIEVSNRAFVTSLRIGRAARMHVPPEQSNAPVALKGEQCASARRSSPCRRIRLAVTMAVVAVVAAPEHIVATPSPLASSTTSQASARKSARTSRASTSTSARYVAKELGFDERQVIVQGDPVRPA